MGEKQVNKYAEFIITCSESHHYKGEMLVEDNSLVRILSGELKVIQGNRTFTFGAGDTYLFPRNQLSVMIKYGKDGQPYRALVMRLQTDYLKKYYRKHDIVSLQPHTHGVLPLESSPLLDGLFASILPYFDLKKEISVKLTQVKMEEAIEILRNIYPHADSILSDFSTAGKIDLTDFMEKNYMFNIPLEKFSYLTGRSLTSFKRDFKKAFQTSPQRWLTQKRLELAHYQLAEQHRKPIDVFYESGFENLSHFSYAFKKHFGYAPTQVPQT